MSLARQGRANLTLFHSYQGLEAIPYQTYGKRYLEPDRIVRLDQKSRNTLSEFAQHVAQKAESGRAEFIPRIQVEFAEGDLSDNIGLLTLKNDIELVVMGATNKTSWGHVLMSNNIAGVINKTAKPVLVVPIESAPRQVKKATFAVNFDDIELQSLRNLVHLAGLFKFDLEIVHVIKAGDAEAAEVKRTFIEKLRKRGHLFSLDYRTLKGKSIVSRLYQQCRRKATDLLAVTHYQYYLLQQLFNKSTTRDALYELKLPLLIFPSGKM